MSVLTEEGTCKGGIVCLSLVLVVRWRKFSAEGSLYECTDSANVGGATGELDRVDLLDGETQPDSTRAC